MTAGSLIFLHLSDIHFHRRSGKAGDLDDDLRRQLENDAVAVRRGLPGFTGILVSGDVAFSGQPQEYDFAKGWLTGLCDKLGCPPEDIWTVPGNHDVDRGVVNKSWLVRQLHVGLRPTKPADVDHAMSQLFADPKAFEAVHEPLAAYNRFAQSYDCEAGGNGQLHWESDLPLNDGSVLRLRGANSALISTSADDDEANRLVVGSLQSLPPVLPGVTHLLLCHHPPDWVWERDQFEDNLRSRVPLALFGHKHVQRVVRVDNSLRVFAGAVQPSRGETGWLPRYNFLALSVDGTGGGRSLRVDILPRLWHDLDKEFRAERDRDGRDTITHSIPLPAWAAPAGLPAAKPAGPAATATAEGRVMNPERRLTYRFFDLPYSRRMEVVQKLGLIADEDEGVREDDRYKRYFERARSRNLLGVLWQEVEGRHSDGRSGENPFAQPK